jgi:hypothetical protein
MCACPQHRGEPAPVLPEVETVGQPISARFPGRCARCGSGIVEGDLIARAADPDAGYAHAEPGRCR